MHSRFLFSLWAAASVIALPSRQAPSDNSVGAIHDRSVDKDGAKSSLWTPRDPGISSDSGAFIQGEKKERAIEARMPARQTTFTKNEINAALVALDAEMETSKNIRQNRPVVVYSAGGYVSVSLFGNRESTHDVDFVLGPGQPNRDKVLQKMLEAIERVADKHNLAKDWMNNQLEQYAYPHIQNEVFANSVSQDNVLFEGKNLVIYAAAWDWQLARKLKILGSVPRPQDLSDAAYILYRLNQKRGRLLTKAEAKAWNDYTTTPIEDRALDNLKSAYQEVYSTPGISD